MGQGGYAVVDVETSGLRPGEHRVLSLAVVQTDRAGTIEKSWSSLLNPGCDPGPVHIHGLSRQVLAGAPQFGAVADTVADLLTGRVLAAHNAAFDWNFLQSEAGLLGRRWPVTERLCTLALSRRLGLDADGVENYRLGTLADYWQIPVTTQHDALADATTTAHLLRHSLGAATAQQMTLPIVECGPGHRRATPSEWVPVPRYDRRWVNPGLLAPGRPLVQGMRVVVSGPTAIPRAALYVRCHEAGLDLANAVNGRSSVLVCNDRGSMTGKSRAAAKLGVPVIDETGLLALLDTVLPGRPAADVANAADAGDVAMAALTTSRQAARSVRRPTPARPGARGPGRAGEAAAQPHRRRPRVLVLGTAGSAVLRDQLATGGTAVAVNLTASVTEVLYLPDGAGDPRLARARTMGIPCRSAAEHRPGPAAEPDLPTGPVVLPRGGVTDLPHQPGSGTVWTLAASWSWVAPAGADLDVVAFLLNQDERVDSDDDMVFFNQPHAPGSTVRLTVDGTAEQAIHLDLDALPPTTTKIAIAAALTGDATFGQVGPLEIVLGADDNGARDATSETSETTEAVRATLDAATTERTLVLAEIYRRRGVWRARAVGQGYDTGLAELATSHGVEVD